jgi:hypothetical protein
VISEGEIVKMGMLLKRFFIVPWLKKGCLANDDDDDDDDDFC